MQCQYDPILYIQDALHTSYAPHNAAVCTNPYHVVHSASLEQIMSFPVLLAAKAKKTKPTHAGGG